MYVSYLINQLQPLPFTSPVIVTLNPVDEPVPATELGHYRYEHPLLDLAAIDAQQRLPAIQGQRRTWFAGASWTGYGFHEDGLKSTVARGARFRRRTVVGNVMNGNGAQLLKVGVLHERLWPAHHRFEYPIVFVRVDMSRLDELACAWFGIDRRLKPLGLQRRDYGPRDGAALEPWMHARLAEAHIPADGTTHLLTIPRVFGCGFNPVSF